MSRESDIDLKTDSKPTLTPPASEEADKHDDSGSELSDLEVEVENNEEIEPDHYYDGGRIPVFKPTMDQFRSFKSFVQKIDRYGMKSGIVKVIPPKEWRDSLPALDEQVKTVKVKNPITQEFHGTHGTYTQANIEKQRSYNLPQWKALSEESNHQPPAKRGERRRNQEKTSRGTSARVRNPPIALSPGKKRGPGRPRVRPLPTTVHQHSEEPGAESTDSKLQVPPTPTSPPSKPAKVKKEHISDDEETLLGKPKGRQPKSVSSRRQHNRRDQADVIDEEAFKDFDYRIHNQSDWTPERCQELETAYWKSLTFNNPMYGADMPGSLFDDSTENWNVAKLENLLDVLGQKVPGVNTAYLYLGMWKASFAWHLEDVDLYSINYIHFGAPKQWYSISQEDARRFEAAMRNVWPNDAKNCDQFLRHKTYLISPQLLQSQYNIRVNRLVHHEGEFVITFPYGYHSGYNLGYNCAESVNFATESWLEYGRVARKCNCEADSVWVDVGDIERKLRGEQTPEYYEETEEEEDEDEEDDGDGPKDLPTPPGSVKGKPKARVQKRKRDTSDKEAKPKNKRLRIRLKIPTHEPCILCPNNNPYEELLPTDNGHKAHRRCALYTPETSIAGEGESERVCDVDCIDKARLELKCNFCRNKRGAVFQCSQKKCTRAYHATCAAQAGVQVDTGLVPVYGEDGTEYTDLGIDFRCRFHRIKRGKNMDGVALEESAFIRKHALKLVVGELVQMQYYQSDIFAGVVLENRKSEQTLLIEVLPKGDKIEVEYKWLLVFDTIHSQLPVPSENAKPLPAHLAQKSRTTAEDPSNDDPKADEPFGDPHSKFIWSEFNTCKPFKNSDQVKIDLSKPKQLWFYLGRTSTEAKAQYTGDPAVSHNNLEANFLESVRAASAAVAVSAQRRSFPASYPSGVNIHAVNAARAKAHVQQAAKIQVKPPVTKERPYNGKYAILDSTPYVYKPKISCNVDPQALRNQRAFQQSTVHSLPQIKSSSAYRAPPAPMSTMAPMAPMMARAPQADLKQENNASVEFRLPSPTTPLSHPYSHSKQQPQETPQQQSPQAKQQPYQHHLHQQKQVAKQSPRRPPQAPVANMMGGNTTPHTNPFSRPPSSHSSPRAFTPSVPPLRNTSEDACDPIIAKYPYLQAAHKLRPKVYQSPYASEGGFTTAYLPNAAVPPPAPPKTFSLSEDFLLKRTLSQQELLRTHKRKISEDRIRHQQAQLRQQSLQQKPQIKLPPSPPNPSLHTHYQSSQPSFYPPQNYQYEYPPPYHNPLHPHPHPQHSLYDPPPPLSQQQQDAGLQFQSPHDFQMQMQREAQQHEWTRAQQGGFDSFFRGLQSAGGAGHEDGVSGGDASRVGLAAGGAAGGTQGSPLKYEMGGGGEMLPMMKDGFSTLGGG